MRCRHCSLGPIPSLIFARLFFSRLHASHIGFVVAAAVNECVPADCRRERALPC